MFMTRYCILVGGDFVSGVLCVTVIVVKSSNRVQNLDKAVCISLRANHHGKGMKTSISLTISNKNGRLGS